MVNDSVKPVSALEKARVKKGFNSATKFAHHVSVPESTYRDHEKHPHRVKGHYLHKYAQALGLSEAELITPTPQPSANVERAAQTPFPINNVEEVERAVQKAKEFHHGRSEMLAALSDLLTRPESAKNTMRLVPALTGLLSMG